MEAATKHPRDQSKHSYREWQKVTAEKWNALSEDQKKVYNDAAKVEFLKHKEEILKWEHKMVRAGNTDIVRDVMAIDRSTEKPKRRPNRKPAASSSDSDWSDGWYPSSLNVVVAATDNLDSTKITSSSSPPLINAIKPPPASATTEKDDTINLESKVKTVSSTINNSNKIEEVDTTSKIEEPKRSEDDNKSKKVLDKLKNLFKF